MYVEWRPGFDWDDFPAAGVNHGIVSVQNHQHSILLCTLDPGGDGYLYTTDGTAWMSRKLNWVHNSTYLLLVRWWSNAATKPSDDANNTGMQIGYSNDNGVTWTWGVRANYDGAYALGTNIRLHYANEFPAHIRNIRIYGKAFDQIDIEGGVENLDGSELVNDFGFFNHNLSSTATITLQADQEDYKNTWNSPLYSTTLPWANKRIIDDTFSQTYRFWKTSFSDVSNVDGYLEGAFWFLGQNLTDTTTGPAFSTIDLKARVGDIRLSWQV